MTAVTVLLANEAGIGRGHITKLRQVAQGFGPGVTCIAGLGRTTHGQELAPYCHEIMQAPALHYTAEAIANPLLEGTATWGDYLAAMGLAREDVVRRSLVWWRQQIIEQNASVLIADYSPLAMRAAQGLKEEGWDIEIISAGTGYGVPPATLQTFPQLLPDYGRVIHPETEVLALLNRVGAETGMNPLPHLPAIYAADLNLVETFAFLDPYRDSRPETDRLAPGVDRTAELASTGDEVFIYFSTHELDEPAILEAICALPLPRRGYFPGAKEDVLLRLARSGIIVEPKPQSVSAITARSRMLLHASQHGTICLAALAGLPQIGLPLHLEQLFHGRRAGQQGILDQLDWFERSVQAVLDMVQQAYHDKWMQRRAIDFARELRPIASVDSQNAIANRLAPVLARAKANLR